MQGRSKLQVFCKMTRALQERISQLVVSPVRIQKMRSASTRSLVSAYDAFHHTGASFFMIAPPPPHSFPNPDIAILILCKFKWTKMV